MPRIKIEDLPIRQELHDEELKSVFGGQTSGANFVFCDGSVRTVSDSIATEGDGSDSDTQMGGATGGVWKTTNFLTTDPS